MRISKNFTSADVEFDLIAVKNKISNKASASVIQCAEDVALNILEKLVEQDFRFNVVSWYRSDALEREYCKISYIEWARKNGKSSSWNSKDWFEYRNEKQHITGSAVSIFSGDLQPIFEFLKTLTFDILQLRDGYIHVSYVEGANRGLVLE